MATDGRTDGRLSSPDRLTDDAHASIHLPLSLSLPLIDVQGRPEGQIFFHFCEWTSQKFAFYATTAAAGVFKFIW